MRFAFLALALMLVTMSPAQATENRLSMNELYNFVNNTNSALSNPNRYIAREYLARVMAENAVIDNRISLYNNNLYQRAWYGHPAYGAYYRYPMNPYYAPTSMHSGGKWDYINNLENRKSRVAGYRTEMNVLGTRLNAYGNAAVVDLELKEYGSMYSPYYMGHVERVKHTHSKCKMHLSKVDDNNIMMTRLDCNTNTSLPF